MASLLQKLQEEAEKNFNSFQDERDGFDDNGFDAEGFDAEGYDIDGNHFSEYEEYEEGFNNEGGLMAGSRTLNVTITNATAAAVDTKLFAPYRGNTATSNVGVSITIDGSAGGYNQFQEEVKANPYVIQGISMFVANSTQFANKLTFTQYESTGELSSQPFIPANHRSPMAQIQTQIVAKNLKFVISGKTELSLIVNANEVINLVLTVAQKTDIANLSVGKSVLVKAAPKKRKMLGRRR